MTDIYVCKKAADTFWRTKRANKLTILSKSFMLYGAEGQRDGIYR